MEIGSLAVLEGSLSPRVRGLVAEWAAQHQVELRTNWDRARRREPLRRYRFHIRFEDGVEGDIDYQRSSLSGVFAPLKDPSAFPAVTVDRDLGAPCWPNDAGLDPDVVYAAVKGLAPPEPVLQPPEGLAPKRVKSQAGEVREMQARAAEERASGGTIL